MALGQQAKQQFLRGNEQFPILYEDSKIRVYKNPTDEVFVEDLRSHVTMRINSSSYPEGGLQFTTGNHVNPFIVNGMIGWSITPPKS